MTAWRGWEATLEQWHRRYHRDRLACVAKTHPPAKLVRGRLAYSARGPPDYIGVLQDGTGIAFEAKESGAKRWRLSQIKPHQAQVLEAYQVMGGVSGVALRWHGDGWWLDWADLGPVYRQKGIGSLTDRTIEEIGTPIDAAEGWITVCRSMSLP